MYDFVFCPQARGLVDWDWTWGYVEGYVSDERVYEVAIDPDMIHIDEALSCAFAAVEDEIVARGVIGGAA